MLSEDIASPSASSEPQPVEIEWPDDNQIHAIVEYLLYLHDSYREYVKSLGRSYLIASAGLGISVRLVAFYAWFNGDRSFDSVEFDEQIRFLNGLSRYFFDLVNNTLENLDHLSQEHAFWYWLLLCVVFAGIPLNALWISLLVTKREYILKNLYDKNKIYIFRLVKEKLSKADEKVNLLKQKVFNFALYEEIELNLQ